MVEGALLHFYCQEYGHSEHKESIKISARIAAIDTAASNVMSKHGLELTGHSYDGSLMSTYVSSSKRCKAGK